MSSTTRILLGVVIILIGLTMFFNKGSLINSQLDQSDSVNLSGINTIMVSGSSEDIKIVTTKDKALHANLRGSYRAFLGSKPELLVEKSGDTLVVKVERKGFSLFSMSDIDLVVEVSEDYAKDFEIKLSSGHIDMPDTYTYDHVKVGLSSGNIVINELNTNQSDINISSGKVTIEGFTGDISGKISSGNAKITYTDFNHSIDFKASSGNLEFNLPQGSNFDLNAKKSSGNITVDFDLTNSTFDNKQVKGTAGKGGNPINLSVSSGNIKIKQN